MLLDSSGTIDAGVPGPFDSMGKMKDKDVAANLGRSLQWVRKKRTRLGIPAYAPELLRDQLAKNTEVLALLGKVSDRSLAAQFGGTHPLYRILREERGIPIFNDEKAKADAELWEKNREEATSLLGKVPDIELARRFGGFQCRYTYLRNKAGIPPFRPNRPVK